MIGPSFYNTAWLMSRLHTSSPRYFQKISSLTSIHYWGWVHQGDQTTFSVHLEGGFFPLGFPSFPHLDLFLSIVWVHYCTGWPMVLVVRALEFHALYVSTSLEYSLRGGVGDIYPPCTLNLVNLALLSHYPKFYWLNWHWRSTIWH